MTKFHAMIAGLVALVTLGSLTYVIRAGQIASVEKARLAAEAKIYKAEKGNQFKIGFTRERRNGE